MMNDLEDTSEALPEDKQYDKDLADNKAKLNTSMFEPILSSKLSPGGRLGQICKYSNPMVGPRAGPPLPTGNHP